MPRHHVVLSPRGAVFHSAVVVAVALSAFAGCGRSRDAAPASPSISAAAGTAAQPTLPPIDPASLDSLIRRAIADKHFVGLSVGVMQNGKVVFAKGYGTRSLAPGDSVTPTTMFGIGSVTKQFTCSSVLLLAEEGKLSLKDHVAKYVPNVTRAADITLLDLGQHVSGYRDYYPLDFVDREMAKTATADEIIQEYAARPLDFEPGTRWSYSNTNFLILGKVVEKVSGESFGAFLARRIFTPLAMRHTRYEPAATDSGLARGYTSFALDAPAPATPEAQGWAGAAGAIWSTPTDLLAWDLALVDGKVLSPDSYRTLTSPRRLADGRSTGYGCGLGVNDRGDAVVFSHGGAVSGFVASNTVVPSTRSAVVILANTDFGATGPINGAILAKLVPHIDVPTIHGPPALEAAKAFLSQLQQGKVDRSALGDDFNAFLTPELIKSGAASLGRIGVISDIQVANTRERGGMEVASVRFKVGNTGAQALMYRTPDGKIQEFLMSRQ